MASYWLEFDQNGAVQQYPFDRPSLSIGRDAGCDFHLDHPTISRKHAMIVHDPYMGYKLVVLSKGGMTAVNGAQVQGEVRLYDGAKLNIGQMAFVFRSQDPAAQAAAPAAMGGMGAGFGGAPASAGFGGQPAGFGGAPASGFGGAPSSGFGGAPSSGFGGAPASGFGGASSAGFGGGSPAPASGFGGPPAAEKPAQKENHGVASWDEIAAQSDDDDDNDGSAGASRAQMTDFERIEAAAAKAKEKDEGVNPMLILVAVVLVGGMAAMTLFGGDGGPATAVVEDEAAVAPVQINVTCLGKDDCLKKAQNAYNVAVQTYERREVTVSNLFESYKKLLEAKRYLEIEKLETPKKMSKLDSLLEQTRKELDDDFRRYRASYHQFQTRQMHRDMAKTLDSVKSVFPDKTSREFKWAAEKEGEMKSAGIYPPSRP
jgi:hypothetical protein